ncbi:hypothetical protein L7F22_042464 [Adiantum nelumboides]|nr:hypothetical protein [Adiantum nelumboides]
MSTAPISIDPKTDEDVKHLGYVCKLKKALYGLKQALRAQLAARHHAWQVQSLSVAIICVGIVSILSKSQVTFLGEKSDSVIGAGPSCSSLWLATDQRDNLLRAAAIPILSSRLQNLSAYRGIPRTENSGSRQAVLYSSMPPSSWLSPSADSGLGVDNFEKHLNGVAGQLSSCSYQQNMTLIKDATDMSVIDNLTSTDVVDSHLCDAGLFNPNIRKSGCTYMPMPLISNYDSESMLVHSKQAAAHVSHDVPCAWSTMLPNYEENFVYLNGTAAPASSHMKDAALRSPSCMNSEQSCFLENIRSATSYQDKEVSNGMMEQYIQKVLELEASHAEEAFASAEMKKVTQLQEELRQQLASPNPSSAQSCAWPSALVTASTTNQHNDFLQNVSCMNYEHESRDIIKTTCGLMEPFQEWQIPVHSIKHGICHVEEMSTNPLGAFEGCLTSTCHAEQQAFNFSSESTFSNTSAGRLSPLSANNMDNNIDSNIDVPTTNSQSGIAAACQQDNDAIRFVSSKEIEIDAIPATQMLVEKIVCAIVDAFPRSVFASQVHLLIHVVEEIAICGVVNINEEEEAHKEISGASKQNEEVEQEMKTCNEESCGASSDEDLQKQSTLHKDKDRDEEEASNVNQDNKETGTSIDKINKEDKDTEDISKIGSTHTGIIGTKVDCETKDYMDGDEHVEINNAFPNTLMVIEKLVLHPMPQLDPKGVHDLTKHLETTSSPNKEEELKELDDETKSKEINKVLEICSCILEEVLDAGKSKQTAKVADIENKNDGDEMILEGDMQVEEQVERNLMLVPM